MAYGTHESPSERFSIPRAPLRQKISVEHIRRRLEDMQAIGPRRMSLGDRGRLVLSQIVHGARLSLEAFETSPCF